MRKIKNLSDIKAREYFDTLDLINKMNTKEITAKEGFESIVKSFEGEKVNFKKLSAKEVETFIGSIIEVINKNEVGEFNKCIKIKGITFGFEPSFEGMEAGAFQDLQDYLTQFEFLKALAVLYRPIDKTFMERRYSIASYVDESNQEFEYRAYLLGEHLSAKDARGVIDFFVNSLLL